MTPGDIPCNALTYATVCSGIECMSVAAMGLPLKPVFFSEIEPYPCAVLKAHYPDVPNLGDMSKIQVSDDGKEITNGSTTIRLVRRVDILAGGTPCQDVSVAGKRAGMQEGSGTRNSLAFDFVRLARELRPRFVIWENVAGSIDSKNAPDFLRFVGALGECGYSLAWRVLDAQYVRVDGMERAVPQRRRRVWVVGCLGADESVPAEILFEPDSVAGHTAPRRRAGQGFAYSLAGRDRVDAGVVGGATERGDGGCLNPLDVQSKRIYQTRNQKDGTGGNNLPLAVFVKTFHAKGKDGDGEKWDAHEVAQTRNTFDIGEKRCQEVVVSTNSNGEDVAPTISSCEYKMRQKQKDASGGYIVTRQEGAKGE